MPRFEVSSSPPPLAVASLTPGSYRWSAVYLWFTIARQPAFSASRSKCRWFFVRLPARVYRSTFAQPCFVTGSRLPGANSPTSAFRIPTANASTLTAVLSAPYYRRHERNSNSVTGALRSLIAQREYDATTSQVTLTSHRSTRRLPAMFALHRPSFRGNRIYRKINRLLAGWPSGLPGNDCNRGASSSDS
jgi:hypothetical protein